MRKKQHGATGAFSFRLFWVVSSIVSLLVIFYIFLLTLSSEIFSGHLYGRLSLFSTVRTLPVLPRSFQSYPALESFGPIADAHWETLLLSPNGGFIKVQRNETFVESWGISMFHSLHCLRMLRDALAPSAPENHHRPSHLTHCFTYLAQSLLCAADDTVEAPVPEYSSQGQITGFRIDGIGVRHNQCRDPTLLYNVASKTEQNPLPRNWTGLDGRIELIWDESVWENGKRVGEIF